MPRFAAKEQEEALSQFRIGVLSEVLSYCNAGESVLMIPVLEYTAPYQTLHWSMKAAFARRSWSEKVAALVWPI